MSRRALVATAVAATAVLAAGCGGSDESASGDTTPTTEWADGLCSSITTWTSSLQSIADSLTGDDLSKDALTGAVDEAKTATEAFTSDLDNLGAPDTDAGQEAKDSVDELATDLRADMAKIEDAVDSASGVSGVLSAVSVISSTLATAGEQVSSTLTGFQDIDAKGELESAFEDSTSCQSLTGGG